MDERIVVVDDGGPAGRAALAWARNRTEADLSAVEVLTFTGVDARPPDEEVERLDRNHRDAILAASAIADLLVLGADRISTEPGSTRSSLALRVAGHSLCPAAVVPIDWTPRSGAVVAGWTTDDTADSALELAAAEAGRAGVALEIVHSWSAPSKSRPGAFEPAAVNAELRARGVVNLARVAERMRSLHPGLDVKTELVAGSAGVGIVRAARDASLIVVGSRGRPALTERLFGSISHDVLRNAPGPVIVVPAAWSPRGGKSPGFLA